MTLSTLFVKVRGVARRKKHLLRELLDLPWWVSLIVASLVYVGLRWLLPAFGSSNQPLQPLSVEQIRAKWPRYAIVLDEAAAFLGVDTRPAE